MNTRRTVALISIVQNKWKEVNRDPDSGGITVRKNFRLSDTSGGGSTAMRLLVVEDEHRLAMALRDLLEAQEYQVDI